MAPDSTSCSQVHVDSSRASEESGTAMEGIAQRWRMSVGFMPLWRMDRALSASPFCPLLATQVWSDVLTSWNDFGGVGDAWLTAPWISRSGRSGEGCDSGQPDNAHCGRDATRHPLMAASRFGSAEAVAWVCSMQGVKPTVMFVDCVEFWSFARAASSGNSGAFAPLWNLAKQLGWGAEKLGEALSDWLMGAQDGPVESMGDSLAAARPALEELMAGNPSFFMPLAPSQVFGTALGAAIVREGLDEERGAKKSGLLIAFAPPSIWVHEATIPDTEAHEASLLDPCETRTFAEDALVVGNPEALILLDKAGYPMPDAARAALVAKGHKDSPEHQAALLYAQESFAQRESLQISVDVPECARQDRALSPGKRRPSL